VEGFRDDPRPDSLQAAGIELGLAQDVEPKRGVLEECVSLWLGEPVELDALRVLLAEWLVSSTSLTATQACRPCQRAGPSSVDPVPCVIVYGQVVRRPTLLLVLLVLLVVPGTAEAARLSSLGSFAQPVYLAAPPGDDRRLMVVEKAGAIRVWRTGGASRLFLDVAAAVGGIQSAGEQGLLSMAFAPDYATSGRFYVYYTAADGQSNRIDEFRVSSNRSIADPRTRRQVLVVPHTTASNHNGGQIAFGPDGFLYAAPGDGGNTPGLAQDNTSLLGKVLRINPRASGPSCPATPSHCYSSPSSNPFAGATPGRDEILHLGLRNPFRFSFDSSRGDLVIGDVGGGLQEEVTLIPNGTPGGRNLGWPICEGTSCSGPVPANYLGPALSYSQPSPRAVTGGVVVRDPRLPELAGRYLYADFYRGVIRSRFLVAGAGAGHGSPIGLTVTNLASLTQDNGGCVYVTSLNGGVFRIAPDGEAGRTPCPLRSTAGGAGHAADPGPRRERAAP
jgi:glucose/arabinose dehydrogenase